MNNTAISGDVDGLDLEINPDAIIFNLKIRCLGKKNKIRIGRSGKIDAYIYVADGAEVVIGDDVKMTGQTTIHAHEGGIVHIGNGCLFSNNVIIRPSDAHKIFDATDGSRINNMKPISIGNSVWIGEHTSILKGAFIPDGCVIATKSVVTGIFNKEACILGGNPAKVIKEGIFWTP